MRSTSDRIRHALVFEVLGLALVVPFGTLLFGVHAGNMGVIGVCSAVVATAWDYLYNLGFDHGMQRLAGHTRKNLPLRAAHALLFEAGLLVILLPPIAWYLSIDFWQALVMDLAIAGFYVAYGFLFNLAYDRVFPCRIGPNPSLRPDRPGSRPFCAGSVASSLSGRVLPL